MITKALVLYHANCDDGFGAAFAFHLTMEKTYLETRYVPVAYGKDFNAGPIDKETSIWILDFSFPGEMLVKFAEMAGNVHLLDHHKTAKESWDQFLRESNYAMPENLDVIFDMNRSGAMMALDFMASFTVHIEYDRLFTFLQDRDLWRFENGDTKNFTQYLRSVPQTFEDWNNVAICLNSVVEYDAIISAGAAITRRYNQLVNEIVDAGMVDVWINGIHGYECNCPPSFASDVGNIIAEMSGTFGHTWMRYKDGGTLHSLRSVKDFDVSEIAKEFGGGGHKNAAGFKIDSKLKMKKIEKLFSYFFPDEVMWQKALAAAQKAVSKKKHH